MVAWRLISTLLINCSLRNSYKNRAVLPIVFNCFATAKQRKCMNYQEFLTFFLYCYSVSHFLYSYGKYGLNTYKCILFLIVSALAGGCIFCETGTPLIIYAPKFMISLRFPT
jgi:hypothetical protein